MSSNVQSVEEDRSINKYRHLFLYYKINKPTLKEALQQLFKSSNLEKKVVRQLTDDILNKCKVKMDSRFNIIKNKYDNIRKEDAYIICSYTCESEDENYSPYRLLNQNLCLDNKQNGIRNVSKYLYIFLKSLRKLPRYYPKNKYLYRCLTIKVNISKDSNNEKTIPYIIGNTKTFWGFTSTSTDPKTTYSFLHKEEKNKNKSILYL